eukprot:1142849-Pelagomonas_calceolata.AAC.6
MRNPREAVVQVGNVSANSALGRLVRVSGRQACNRALHGDTVAGEEGYGEVAVRLLPQSTPSAGAATADGQGSLANKGMGTDGSMEIDATEEVDDVADSGAQIMGGAGAVGDWGAGDGPELVVDGEGTGGWLEDDVETCARQMKERSASRLASSCTCACAHSHASAATGDEEGAAAVLSSTDELELLPMGEVVSLLQRSAHRCAHVFKCVGVEGSLVRGMRCGSYRGSQSSAVGPAPMPGKVQCGAH